MEAKLALIATGEMAAEKAEKDSVRSFGQAGRRTSWRA
jgi:hypothetical protein